MDEAIESITIRGCYLWKGNERFMVRGVVYQDYTSPDPIDPISDDRLPVLQRDVALFQELGINTILVYWIDASKDHTEAMKMLEDADIYVLAGASTQFTAINRLGPYESYKQDNVKTYFRTVDVMAQYRNTLGVFAAYTTVNNEQTTSAAPVISSVVRDIKKYMQLQSKATGQRVLPVGYGAAATNERDRALLHYLSSGSEEQCIDFWTCTSGSLLNETGTKELGFDDLARRYQHANLPMFFSEYGYPRRPRLFEMTAALFSPGMSVGFSGGCVYEFYGGGNGYGLVKTERTAHELPGGVSEQQSLPNHRIRHTEQGKLFVFDEFENYKAQLAATKDTQPTTHSDTPLRGLDVSLEQLSKFTGQIPETCVDWTALDG